VNLEEFSSENPPFSSHCGHNLSLNALRKPEVHTILVDKKETNIMNCPLCRELFFFSSLNTTYLHVLFVLNASKRDQFTETFWKRQEDLNKKLRKLPQIFSPRGRVFSFIKERKKKETDENQLIEINISWWDFFFVVAVDFFINAVIYFKHSYNFT